VFVGVWPRGGCHPGASLPCISTPRCFLLHAFPSCMPSHSHASGRACKRRVAFTGGRCRHLTRSAAAAAEGAHAHAPTTTTTTEREIPASHPTDSTLHTHQPATNRRRHRQIITFAVSALLHIYKAAAMAAKAAPWTRSAQGALDDLQTSLQGLSADEVERRRQQHGFNELQKEPGKPMWRLILEQFDDMLVKVGCVAVWSDWQGWLRQPGGRLGRHATLDACCTGAPSVGRWQHVWWLAAHTGWQPAGQPHPARSSCAQHHTALCERGAGWPSASVCQQLCTAANNSTPACCCCCVLLRVAADPACSCTRVLCSSLL
jgi:hypothetical protein